MFIVIWLILVFFVPAYSRLTLSSCVQVKSVMVAQPISREGISKMVLLRCNECNQLNQIEWKAHAGVVSVTEYNTHKTNNRRLLGSESDYLVADKVGSKHSDGAAHPMYTDDRSPLVRGELFEMHYGNSESSPSEDNDLLTNISTISVCVSQYIQHNYDTSYIGYIDFNLTTPGESYFGVENTAKLRNLLCDVDPKRVLRTNMSDYLFGTVNYN